MPQPLTERSTSVAKQVDTEGAQLTVRYSLQKAVSRSLNPTNSLVVEDRYLTSNGN